jgi:hypothetical protein
MVIQAAETGRAFFSFLFFVLHPYIYIHSVDVCCLVWTAILASGDVPTQRGFGPRPDAKTILATSFSNHPRDHHTDTRLRSSGVLGGWRTEYWSTRGVRVVVRALARGRLEEESFLGARFYDTERVPAAPVCGQRRYVLEREAKPGIYGD